MKNRFIILVDKLQQILLGKTPEKEIGQLGDLLNEFELQRIIDECRDKDFLLKKLDEYRSFSSEQAYRKFLFQAQHRSVWRKILPWSAAALILISVGVGMWRSGDYPSAETVGSGNVVIGPGIKKAQLKLADGSTIDMAGDSLHIEKMEGVKIAYMNGTVSYATEKKITTLVYNELIVPVAGECYIILDEGTRVWINSDSRLKYPVKFVGDERKVFLEGEAYFEVMKGSKPFVVSTAMGEVNVLGTAFDVKAYKTEEAVYTTLVNGRVNFKGKETLILEPGEQAVAFINGKMEKRKVDIDEYIGWKNGLYVFRKQNLESIMNDLARWYDVSVFYQTPGLKDIAFTGNLKRYDNINAFMEILARTGDIKYNIEGNTILLYK